MFLYILCNVVEVRGDEGHGLCANYLHPVITSVALFNLCPVYNNGDGVVELVCASRLEIKQ